VASRIPQCYRCYIGYRITKRRSSGVAPRACVRVYTRVLVPPNLYIIYIHTYI